MRERFWERYSLGELNAREWEALCDGCGQCCLLREVDDDNRVTVFGIGCELLDVDASRCMDYANRQQRVPDCHRLTPTSVPDYDWLPDSCAYRRLHQGKPLPDWHPLLTGSRQLMRSKGITVSGYALHYHDVPRRRQKHHVIRRHRL